MKKAVFFLKLITGIFGLSAAVCQSVHASNNILLIIANKQMTAKLSEPISLDDVLSFYAMKRKLLSNGERATLLTHQLDSEASILFCKHLLDSFPYQVKRKWDVAVFSGRAIRPITLDTNQAIFTYIGENENAIGYVLVDSTQINQIEENFHVIATFN
ncbi:hypothetical protein [Glaciecola petra]|uniref:Orphan protein n=1 Tax=Glaciecola petra TaxID=3075602 RepID=A0ABU2ZT45_9ALTE|nr:hypothetical protein [Aestuariibacter sp. P117]MDT0595815.1 hypothetical protein [Aestuariibacter sp. P117]